MYPSPNSVIKTDNLHRLKGDVVTRADLGLPARDSASQSVPLPPFSLGCVDI
jgi:hypothetical protein